MGRSSIEAWRRRLLLAVGLLLALVPLAAAEPRVVGEWSPLTTFPVSMTHAHLLPTGKVMFFGEFEEGLTPPQLWDPATGMLSALPLADYNIFCVGHSFLADGRLLLTGGHEVSHVGLPYVSIFDPFTLTWSRGPDMNDNRWYPTNTTLPNGDVVVLSGETHASGLTDELPQVWRADTNTFRDLTTALRALPYYPRTFLAPNGKLFYAGPQRLSRWLDTEGTGTWYEGPRSAYNGRAYGSAVMIDSKVLIIGGGSPPTATVEEIDLAAPAPVWKPLAPMAWPRRQLNATLMPDGKVLVTGGSSGSNFDDGSQPVKVPELYDPETNTWTKLAPAADYRGYHSTALLLPDGRVLTGGGRNERTAELFTPPYLEQEGARPAIQEVPAVITPGKDFLVRTLDAARVAKVTLIALGSVTHAFDQNQRLLKLPFSQTSGGLDVTAPASNLAAPPGYYMLFIVDSMGVPSVARIVRVAQVTPAARKKIVLSDTWKYDDRGIDQGTAWLARDFDDSAWKTGAGQLGYGDGDEGTVLATGSPTVYFRKKLILDDTVTAANLEVLYDDAIAVWINGVPVFSRNMGNGTGFGAWASGTTTNAYERVSLPLAANPFRVGENVVTAMVKQVAASSNDLTFALALEVEQATRTETTVTAIPFRSVWKYQDNGVDPGPSWNTADFDDSAWKSGAGQLGYGDGDEATVLTRTSPSQSGVYFRKQLIVNGTVTQAHLRVLFDDGYGVYVNGTRVSARNVDKGLAHGKYATASTENELAGDSIPAGVFVQGENTIAVVVKQNGATSPDLTFDLELQLGIITGR